MVFGARRAQMARWTQSVVEVRDEEGVMSEARRLFIPGQVPEEFADAVATILLLGVAGRDLWDRILMAPPEKALAWIRGILDANETAGLVHADIQWWRHQVYGH